MAVLKQKSRQQRLKSLKTEANVKGKRSIDSNSVLSQRPSKEILDQPELNFNAMSIFDDLAAADQAPHQNDKKPSQRSLTTL